MTNNIVFVIIGQIHKNITLTSIMFDFYGTNTEQCIIEADTWEEGYILANRTDSTHAVFVSSGTVFTNVIKFLEELNKYPHYGLVGHIVDPKNENAFWLHKQCLYLDLSLFDVEDFSVQDFVSIEPIRSPNNIHHDYTPTWLRPSTNTRQYRGQHFGERLIAKQLAAGRPVVNFHQNLRQHKTYCYKQEDVDQYLKDQQDYIELAEKQLWVFNNENYKIYNVHDTLICPASGLYWILHLISTDVKLIKLVDISKTQIQFAKDLWTFWDGLNYGKFVSNFICQYKIKHFHLDNPKIGKLDRIKLLKPSTLIDSVNNIFQQQCHRNNINNFAVKWQAAKNKNIEFYNRDIIDFLKEDNNQSDVWLSNIPDYKYTLLKHQYTKLINEHHTKN